MAASDAPTRPGRVMQKERTRQALLIAARELIAEGKPPSVADAAKRALVSEPTAYRYYSSARSLLRDALKARWPDLESVVNEVRTVAGAEMRARIAAEAMARNVLAQEPHVRALIALSYSSDAGGDAGDVRPAYRMPLIKLIMDALPERLPQRERNRLKLALCTVISAEAVFSLKDSQKCSDRETIATVGYIAQQLVNAASGAKSKLA